VSDISDREATKQISVITIAIIIAFCSLLFKCTYSTNQDALNYHKAVKACKKDIACIECYVVATSSMIKSCGGAK
jgi:hypothetical protein